MTMTAMFRLIGAVPSPYSVKMRAILRYRRAHFIWDRIGDKHVSEIGSFKPPTMPYLVYPDGSIRNDTTLLTYDLEERYPSDRSVLTGDPCLNFLSHLIEDFADEWGTRMMAHYRWNYEADQEFCSLWIGDELHVGKDRSARAIEQTKFRDRQMGRRLLLGVSPSNKEILEDTYRAVLASLSDMLNQQEFLFGTRPSLADFGLFGQLFQMTVDPTSSSVMRRDAPQVLAWILRLDDASGVDGDWQDYNAPLLPAVDQLLDLIGRTHLPLLVANAAASKAAQSIVQVQLDGKPYEQSTNKYHVKCLNWLREEYHSLDSSARKRVDSYLKATQCLPLLIG